MVKFFLYLVVTLFFNRLMVSVSFVMSSIGLAKNSSSVIPTLSRDFGSDKIPDPVIRINSRLG